MGKYIVVVHSWHVTSRGFIVEQVEASNLDEATGMAHKIADRIDSFYDRSVRVIPLESTEKIKRSRLTWRERLTGTINR